MSQTRHTHLVNVKNQLSSNVDEHKYTEYSNQNRQLAVNSCCLVVHIKLKLNITVHVNGESLL